MTTDRELLYRAYLAYLRDATDECTRLTVPTREIVNHRGTRYITLRDDNNKLISVYYIRPDQRLMKVRKPNYPKSIKD